MEGFGSATTSFPPSADVAAERDLRPGAGVARESLTTFNDVGAAVGVTAGSTAALVTMEFELFDRKTAKTVWTHFYSHSEPVQGKEIPVVVSALDRNLVRGLTEVTSGLDGYFSANLAGKS